MLSSAEQQELADLERRDSSLDSGLLGAEGSRLRELQAKAVAPNTVATPQALTPSGSTLTGVAPPQSFSADGTVLVSLDNLSPGQRQMLTAELGPLENLIAPGPATSSLDQRVAPFSPEQQQALGTTAALTPGTQALADIGAIQSGQTIAGRYLNDPTGPSPYLAPMERTVAGRYLANPTGPNPYLRPMEQTVAGRYLSGPTGANPYLAAQVPTIAGAYTARPTGDNRYLQGLERTMAGAFLRPETNPYLKANFDAASSDLVNAYSTATAPGIMAAAQRARQFGSSAMNESLALSRYGLGRNLENLAANIYGTNYQQERSRQLTAEQQGVSTYQDAYARERAAQEAALSQGTNIYGTSYQSERAAQEAQARALADIYRTGYTTERGFQENNAQNLANLYQTGYQGERGRQLQTVGMLPSTLGAIYYPQQTLMGVGAQRQEQEQAGLNTAYSNAVSATEFPFSILSGFGGALGQAGSGAGTSTTTTKGSSGGGFFGK